MITGALGVYLIEASILLIILYLFNNWLLSQETAHRMNRAVWLISIVFSFALPFVSLQSVDYIEPMAGITFGEIAVESEIAAQAGAPAIFSLYNIVNTLLFIYLCGVVVCAIYMFIGYFSLISLVYNGRYNLSNSANAEDKTLLYRLIGYQRFAAVDRDIRYVIHDNDNLSPFSWFNSVVVSRSDIEANDREIILHELSHISQRHSLDVLLLNLATIILWFNPASWLTKRALQQVHEYCADDAVLSLGINVKEYQLLLIRKAVGARLYSMSNSLNHSNLKNRITMMLQKKSNKMAAAKCLYAIPLVILAIALFTSPALADSTSAISEVKITNYLVNNQIDDQKVELNESGGSSHGADTKPYIVVNDKLAPDADINSIDPNKIESVSIVKDVNSSEFKRYNIDGDRSVGLVIIELKEGETLESARISAAS